MANGNTLSPVCCWFHNAALMRPVCPCCPSSRHGSPLPFLAVCADFRTTDCNGNGDGNSCFIFHSHSSGKHHAMPGDRWAKTRRFWPCLRFVSFLLFFCLAVQVNAIPGLQCSQFSGHRKPQTVSKWSCQNVCSMLACCMQPVRTSTLGWTAFIIHPFLGMGVTWSPGWKRQCENCFVCGIKTSSSGPELSSSPRAAGRFSDGRGFRPAYALITSGSCHMQINQNPGVFQMQGSVSNP